MRIPKKYYTVAILLLGSLLLRAQPTTTDSQAVAAPVSTTVQEPQPTPFVVGLIYIEGNKRTKSYIIKRELPFNTGDSIYLPDLVKGFEIGRQQLFNTGLFNEVIVALKAFRGYEVDIIIQVKERWYLFPLPYLRPVDRNLSEWARQGYGLDRINYGLKFISFLGIQNSYNSSMISLMPIKPCGMALALAFPIHSTEKSIMLPSITSKCLSIPSQMASVVGKGK
jgi:hypothetical protein